jgi:hypothetical protein
MKKNLLSMLKMTGPDEPDDASDASQPEPSQDLSQPSQSQELSQPELDEGLDEGVEDLEVDPGVDEYPVGIRVSQDVRDRVRRLTKLLPRLRPYVAMRFSSHGVMRLALLRGLEDLEMQVRKGGVR